MFICYSCKAPDLIMMQMVQELTELTNNKPKRKKGSMKGQESCLIADIQCKKHLNPAWLDISSIFSDRKRSFRFGVLCFMIMVYYDRMKIICGTPPQQQQQQQIAFPTANPGTCTASCKHFEINLELDPGLDCSLKCKAYLM